jgi:UDP-N-acetylglucosamine 2-epimerase (non-hydrolysing)
MNILICYGTRPEWLKIKPLWELSKDSFKLLKINQHQELLKDLPFDYELLYTHNCQNRLNEIITNNLSYVLEDSSFDAILVQGDTTSAFSIALSAYHHEIPIIHLEAGLRTYSKNPFPEEFNRRAIALMADLHFCPTSDNLINLENELISGEKYVVGNTILDNLVGVNTIDNNLVLVTLHRFENRPIMDRWFIELENIAKLNPHLQFILPLHPNPDIRKFRHLLNSVEVVEPLPHDELLQIIAQSSFIITDSGGIQEEASFLKKRVLVCRSKTERAETIGISSWYSTPETLEKQVRLMQEDLYSIPKNYICPYGTGRSCEEIISILRRHYYE